LLSITICAHQLGSAAIDPALLDDPEFVLDVTAQVDVESKV
jgi:hypothetical protein